MKLHNFNSAPKEDESYTLYDFSALTDYSLSVKVDDEKLSNGKKCELLLGVQGGVYAQKNYEIDGRIFYYCTDGCVWESINGKCKKISVLTFSLAPKIFSCNYRGEKTLLIASNGYCFTIGKYYDTFKMPDGEHHLAYKNGVYFAKDETVFFCKDFFKAEGKRVYACVRPDQEEGRVCGMFIRHGSLFVIYERGIYKFVSPFDNAKTEFFKVVTLNEKPISVCNIGDKTYLAYSGEICEFDGSTAKSIKKFKNDFIKELVVCAGNCYAILDRIGVDYCYGITEGYYLEGKAFLGVKEFNDGRRMQWKSVPIDFGKRGKKTLKGINLKTKNAFNLTVCFDGKEKEFFTQNGKIRTNISAEKFAIKLTPKDNIFTVENIEFLYAK